MPINKETHVSASTILTKEMYEKIKALAKKNKRSISSQIAYILEQYIEGSEEKE